ncbi:hypothetical protein LTR05_007289 [Lithohypha guttulata]|uniref:Uncharacterized protein n=1 Tax=Lithohypha guttulata TaxID=1690604 RepID=A0AAN7SUS4_9EURO|nr:hypothetical protein LTR05_007289 [Lithohypha guttulata]
MLQKGYSDMDLERFNPVSISGMQTRDTDILHGTFRTEMKLEGYKGGSCASFFWYHNDVQEIDIEVVTPGTSIVNDTINYTAQPSTEADWTPIPNATLSMPLQKTLNDFKVHRFDCNPVSGVDYYLDDKLMHNDHHNVPKEGGSLQLKLWADGNQWWSGIPSKTDVHLRVKSIIAYYNTTSSLTNLEWHNKCAREKKQCKAVTSLRKVAALDPFGIPISISPTSSALATWEQASKMVMVLGGAVSALIFWGL